jgi:hypothetical protein
VSDLSTETYVLPSGAEIEIATIPDRRSGASDVSFDRGGRIPFEKVIAPLGEVAEMLFAQIRSSVKEPSAITLEFKASIKGQTRLAIVSGEGEGSIKVSLTWKNASHCDDPE